LGEEAPRQHLDMSDVLGNKSYAPVGKTFKVR